MTITMLIIAAIPATIASIVTAIVTVRTFSVTKSTHELVNGSMTLQLRLHAKTARSKADITHNDVDIAVAELAEKILKEHEDRRSIIEVSMDKDDFPA